MAPRIQILSSTLIDQIAAGEVVERPASVVKELVENALDAGATRVVCRIEAGGAAGIQVTDDGHGMGPEDIALAVVRHATSKIARLEDLERIASLGFRGEALPSIAAVSRFKLTSRRREDEIGHVLTLEGGGRPSVAPVGAPVGTDVLVRDLFYNTPARKKFMRASGTEMGHVSGWFQNLSLARPDVHFRLEHNGRLVLDAPAAADRAQRAAAVLGREIFEHLLPISLAEPDLGIEGLITDPGHSHKNTRGIHLFVNGRFVRDRLLQYAIMEGYRTVLPDGRFPLVVLAVAIRPDLVDVNVHPQKIEVRFADAGRVQAALTRAIAVTLARTPWIDFGGTRDLGGLQAGQASSESVLDAQARAERIRSAVLRSGPRAWLERGPWPRPVPPLANVAGPVASAKAESRPYSQFALVGRLWNTYLLLSDEERLVVVDQHAAHERIVFERLRRASEAGQVAVQRLLVPLQLEVGPAGVSAAESFGERLQALGLQIDPFGPTVVSVKALPAVLSGDRAAALARDVLEELADTEGTSSPEVRHLAVLSRMACHAAVRAGQALSEAEVRALLDDLERVDYAGQCPHGRPVLVELSRDEVGHWFHRS